MAQDRIAETIKGLVACSNDRGVKLEGAEDWLNVSRYADAVAIPKKGDLVLLGLDKAGFIREIAITAAAPTPTPAEQAAPLGNPDRETRITRSASINAAIAALKVDGPVDETELFALAGRIENWVSR